MPAVGQAAEAVAQQRGDHVADHRVEGLGVQGDRPGEAQVMVRQPPGQRWRHEHRRVQAPRDLPAHLGGQRDVGERGFVAAE